MGEGNRFHRELVEPATDALLGDVSGLMVLDAGCGNGQYARRLARRGAQVVAFDASAEMVRLAGERTGDEAVELLVADATAPDLAERLGGRAFDAAVGTMAIMDIEDAGAVFSNVRAVLADGAPFVFTVMHPAFNTTGTALWAEAIERGDRFGTAYGVRVERYLSLGPSRGEAMAGQPEVQWYFHRPLHELLGAAFAAGFVVDGLLEPAFAPETDEPRSDLHWDGRYAEFPPVLAVRLR